MTDEAYPYFVRISPRARRILIRLVPGRGLEVVLPRGTRARDAEDLAARAVARKRAWIERTAERLRRRGAVLTPEPPAVPGAVDLPALGESWPVRRAQSAAMSGSGPGGPGQAPRGRVVENAGELMVSGPEKAALAALRDWVRARAGAELPSMLGELSRRTGLTGYERVQIRLQKTRWGSCSPRGTISLNAKLLFLPPELARHALVHELCHLRRGGHGPGFRRELARHAPDHARLERELSRAGALVPGWMEAE
jgi:hypothetical protein